MKPFFLGATTLLMVSIFSTAKANFPPIPTMEEKVASAKYIFIGVADKVKIFKVRPEDVYPKERNSSRKRLPVFPGPYRLFEFDVRLTEVIKSDKQRRPRRMKLKLLRAFLDEENMKRDVAEIVAKFSRRKQIYLVNRVDLFSTEDVSECPHVKGLVQNVRMKARASAQPR